MKVLNVWVGLNHILILKEYHKLKLYDCKYKHHAPSKIINSKIVENQCGNSDINQSNDANDVTSAIR